MDEGRGAAPFLGLQTLHVAPSPVPGNFKALNKQFE